MAGQESRDCFDLISDVGIRGIYLSLDYWNCKIQTTTADFIKKGTFSVHSFNDDYLFIPERPGS